MKPAHLSDLARSAQAEAVGRLLDGGRLCLYSAAGARLAELRFASPAFSPDGPGSVRANPIAPDPDARGDGDAAWFGCETSDGQPVLSGDVGVTGSEAALQLRTLWIPRGAEVVVGAFTYSVPRAEEA